jgi:hypothetical protein
MNKNDLIGLVDMDGTLANYDGAMARDLAKLASPDEPFEEIGYGKRHPDHIWARMELIKANGEWWENLPCFKLGFDVLKILQEQDFYISVLTQGPRTNPVAWSHKVKWCFKNIPDIDITITRNKGLVYGRVLVDDYPEYIEQWLEYRPRGLVIMPAQKWNKDYDITSKNVIRYDGSNLGEVKRALKIARDREAGQELVL